MLNLDHDEARALHRIVRAMHDGECPKCHTVHAAEKMPTYFWGKRGDKTQVGWECPHCLFSITMDEAEAVFDLFAPFMERNLAIFEKWRDERKVCHD